MSSPPLTWVVGAGGLLGHHVLHQAAARGPVFSGPTVPWSRPEAARVVLREAAERLVAESAGGRWQVVWCAGSGVTGTSRTDLDDELAALRACLDGLAGAVRGSGTVFFASSVGGVYAGVEAPPYTESSPVMPLADYGRAKIEAEAIVGGWVEAHGQRALVGRIANLYGPGQNLAKPQGLVSQLCAAHLSRRPLTIWVSLDTRRDYIYAPDCAALVLDCLDRTRADAGQGQTVLKLLGSQRALSIGAILGELRRVFRSKSTIILGASPVAAMQARDLSMRSEVWPDLDQRPLTPFPAGVARTLLDLRLRMQHGDVSA
jgi:UDP-glucose 4-epimerase